MPSNFYIGKKDIIWCGFQALNLFKSLRPVLGIYGKNEPYIIKFHLILEIELDLYKL